MSNITTNKNKQKSTTGARASQVLSDEELSAMKETIAERKASARRGAHPDAVEVEAEVLAKIDELAEPDRGMARRVHALIKASVPTLSPRLWYGMPAYYKDGKNICFFQSASKFKARYATLGFNDSAHLDEGDLWPVAFALKDLTPAVEARIAALVKKAAS